MSTLNGPLVTLLLTVDHVPKAVREGELAGQVSPLMLISMLCPCSYMAVVQNTCLQNGHNVGSLFG